MHASHHGCCDCGVAFPSPGSSAVDVIFFVREIVDTYPKLRTDILSKLNIMFPMVTVHIILCMPSRCTSCPPTLACAPHPQPPPRADPVPPCGALSAVDPGPVQHRAPELPRGVRDHLHGAREGGRQGRHV